MGRDGNGRQLVRLAEFRSAQPCRRGRPPGAGRGGRPAAARARVRLPCETGRRAWAGAFDFLWRHRASWQADAPVHARTTQSHRAEDAAAAHPDRPACAGAGHPRQDGWHGRVRHRCACRRHAVCAPEAAAHALRFQSRVHRRLGCQEGQRLSALGSLAGPQRQRARLGHGVRGKLRCRRARGRPGAGEVARRRGGPRVRAGHRQLWHEAAGRRDPGRPRGRR
ncbi:hypothetical protein JaAD80_25825 [Janthinobacterium sp. AD80]|nr:hypothetical protein JaAD80_25825 [Janthinobacterium sp. AD80]